jgi:hypothetical protein
VADWIVDVSPNSIRLPKESATTAGRLHLAGWRCAARFQQQYAGILVLGESGSDDTTGGAGSHDDDIVGSGLA